MGRKGQAEARGRCPDRTSRPPASCTLLLLIPPGRQAEGQADPDGGVAAGVRLWPALGPTARSTGRGPTGGHLPGPPPAARYSERTEREAAGGLAGQTRPWEPFGLLSGCFEGSWLSPKKKSLSGRDCLTSPTTWAPPLTVLSLPESFLQCPQPSCTL